MASTQKKEKNQNIQVFVRVRPLNSMERSQKSLNVVDCSSSKELVITERPIEKITKTFSFDRVFGLNSKQIDVYMKVVHPIIEEVLAGYNCTVFAYGQTGTGKTFTMIGEKTKDIAVTWDNDPLLGIIPRTLSNLFDELRIQQVEHTVRVSFLELYNEELFDLLSPGDDTSKIKLFEDGAKKGSVIIHGLEEVTVHNKNEVYAILEKGSLKRQTAATLMNAQSSRSHTVFSITVHIKENSIDGEELLKTGKLNLVDLAGSENIGRSGAVNKRAREAGNINQSLLTLGRVITALVERAPHIPYRESKLTRILQDSLGGRTKTSIIATISPALCNLEETLSTLDYAHRAKNITNRPEINQKLSKKALIKEYTEEIERLRRDLQATREKSGVYLESANYTQMITQLEQQEQEISQMLSHMKALKEEKDKKEELCNQLHISLENCNRTLAATSNELGETQYKLNVTSQKLHNTINICLEKSHLIDKHMQTEQVLTSQAKSLIAVADMASSDTDKLHDKLARKRSVEDANHGISRNFHETFAQNIAYMGDNVNHFTQDLIKFCLGLQTNLGERLEKKGTELSSLSNEMSSLVESQTNIIQDLDNMASNQVYNGQQWIQQHLTAVRSTSDNEVNKLHKFFAETFLTRMRNLARQLQLQEAKNQADNRMIVDQVQQMLDTVKTFEAAQSDGFTQIRDNLLLHAKQQEMALDTTQEGFKNLQKSETEFKETFSAEMQQLKNLADRILNLHATFENHNNENRNIITSGLSTVREKCDAIFQQVSTSMDVQLKRRIDHLNMYEAQSEETVESINSFRESSEQLISESKKLEEDVQNRVQLAVTDSETTWRNHYSWSEQELRKYSESLNEELQNELKQTQNLMTGLRESAETHESILEQQRVDFGTFVHKHQDDLESECTYINEWSHSLESELQKRNQEVDKFLLKELRTDVPTGHTPQRREFVYPRVLAETSPHERILQRFRMVNDAPPEHPIILQQPSEFVEHSTILTLNSSNEGSTSDLESTNNTVQKSSSSSDISSAGDSVFNISCHSEPGSFKENKENSNSLKKYNSEELKNSKNNLPKTASVRKALRSQN